MNLKMVKILTLSIVIFLTAFSASASDQLAASISLKSFYVIDWSNKFNDGTSDYKYELKNPVFMMGPSLKINYGKFFTGLTYLTSTDSAFVVEMNDMKVGEGSRHDVDFIIGYSPLSWLSVIGGYKRIDAKTTQSYGSTVTIAVGGPAAGISLNYLIPNTPVFVYANAAYMYLDGQAWLQDVWANAYSYEVGVTYSPINHLALSIGYKGQVIEYSKDIAGKDEMSGITFSIDYRF